MERRTNLTNFGRTALLRPTVASRENGRLKLITYCQWLQFTMKLCANAQLIMFASKRLPTLDPVWNSAKNFLSFAKFRRTALKSFAGRFCNPPGPNADLHFPPAVMHSSHDRKKRQFDWIVHLETLLLIFCDENWTKELCYSLNNLCFVNDSKKLTVSHPKFKPILCNCAKSRATERTAHLQQPHKLGTDFCICLRFNHNLRGNCL